MAYEAELNFLKKLLAQFHLKMHIINKANPLNEEVDLGIRKFLGIEEEHGKCFQSFLQNVQSNTVYKISDDFFCNYIVMLLPEYHSKDKSFLIIGPYTEQDFSKQAIFRAIEKHQVPPKLTKRLMQYYAGITLISDATPISAIFTAFADTI